LAPILVNQKDKQSNRISVNGININAILLRLLELIVTFIPLSLNQSNMRKSLALIIAVNLLIACNKEPKEDSTADIRIDKAVGNADVTDVVMESPSASAVNQVKFPAPLVAVDKEQVDSKTVLKKVIKDGNISFETASIGDTRKAIYAKIKSLDGYISNENENNNTDVNQKTYTITAHVPAKSFDAFVSGVAENALKIDSKNISTRDVTAQYIDITTRLANKKKLEERYLELLKKGSKISDLLEIENKLTEIRTDIESTQGQLNYLNKQIDYSTLEITFHTKQTVKENRATFGYRIKTALIDGWEGLVGLFFWIVSSWHYWLILTIVIVSIRRWRSNLRRKKGNA
jgi:hypothetical protein